MRVSRPTSGKPMSGVSKAKPSSDTSFSNLVSGSNSNTSADQAASSAATGGIAGVGGVDSIMALQGMDTSTEGRSKALRKGRRMLDALDKLQLSVLNGQTSEAHLGLLQRALEEAREESGDDGLDDALGHIEVRTAVEIAKLERRKKEVR